MYFQARALTAQVAETEAIRFLVGTQSLRFENQVCEVHGMCIKVLLNVRRAKRTRTLIWSFHICVDLLCQV